LAEGREGGRNGEGRERERRAGGRVLERGIGASTVAVYKRRRREGRDGGEEKS